MCASSQREFTEHSWVQELYLQNVPHKLSEKDFWTRYFRQKARTETRGGADSTNVDAKLRADEEKKKDDDAFFSGAPKKQKLQACIVTCCEYYTGFCGVYCAFWQGLLIPFTLPPRQPKSTIIPSGGSVTVQVTIAPRSPTPTP